MDTDYGYHAGAFVQHYHLFQQSRNAVEGRRVSDTELGAATIRLAIEARLKRAVGIFWTYSPTTQKRTPLKMSILFNAFRERSADIEAATDLEVVKLIYDWSNNYIHAGMRSPTWLNFFAHDLLDPLFVPRSLDKGPSFDFGLAMERQTLSDLRETIRVRSRKDAVLEGLLETECVVGTD